MPANTSPIFTLTPNIGGIQLGSTANVKSDGAGTIATDLYKAFTAGSSGSFVQRIRLFPISSAAATSTNATTLRIFISSLTSGATTASNTYLFAEVSPGIITADHSTASATYFEIALNFALPASYTILVSQHLAPATNTSWMAVVIGADY